MARYVLLSYHTSPLTQPGTGDGGGMNVYVRESGAALARAGHTVDVFTRRSHPDQPDVVSLEPGLRVHHVDAGPATTLTRDELPTFVTDFRDGVRAIVAAGPPPDVVHAHYWLSAVAGHDLKHEWNVPLLVTFHTLERVKADALGSSDAHRIAEEERIIGCADAVLANCQPDADHLVSLYGARPDRVHIVALGVEHALFSPGPRAAARAAVGRRDSRPLALYVGRLQTLKGVDLALQTVITLNQSGTDIDLAIIGGPSGHDGGDMLMSLHDAVAAAGLVERVHFIAPQPHTLLSSWFRAADVTLVPSRAESFGLVALESLACGTPVVASNVGGLATLVRDGVTGALLSTRDPHDWATAVRGVITPTTNAAMATAAAASARPYTWRSAAAAIDAIASHLCAHQLVSC